MSYYFYQDYKIYYQEIGKGYPLVMLHGNTASSAMFSGIAQKYAEDYKVILIDFVGYGKSERARKLPEDLWYDQAMQVICFLEKQGYGKVNLIGTSGGALAAINVALERPDLVNKVIADSFEGEKANPYITEALRQGREASKHDDGAKAFYEMMNGADWEKVVDADTEAVMAHATNIVDFFHRPFSTLTTPILLTGSLEDPFADKGFFATLFKELLSKIEHGEQYLFDHGGHPAMLSNQEKFIRISKSFLA